MRDNLWRYAVKRAVAWRYLTDARISRAIRRWRGQLEYDLHGHCNSCGGCCETPEISVLAIVFHVRVLRWLCLTWHRLVNGFELIDVDRPSHTFIFRCTHYDPTTHRCDAYNSRPGFCRDYPRLRLDDTDPQFLPRCGYYAIARDAKTIRQTLTELDLPPDKLTELQRKFHVLPPADNDDRGQNPPRAA